MKYNGEGWSDRSLGVCRDFESGITDGVMKSVEVVPEVSVMERWSNEICGGCESGITDGVMKSVQGLKVVSLME